MWLLLTHTWQEAYDHEHDVTFQLTVDRKAAESTCEVKKTQRDPQVKNISLRPGWKQLVEGIRAGIIDVRHRCPPFRLKQEWYLSRMIL